MVNALPTAMNIWAEVENSQRCPVTIGQGRLWLVNFERDHSLAEVAWEQESENSHVIVLRGEELWYRYEQKGEDIIKGLSLTLRQGELFALLGGIGGGKTPSLMLVGVVY